jgi:hypothetical protein
MSWEAFRLTSKTPSELLITLGPHGVDDLIRQALNAVWRDYPVETRSYSNVRKAAAEVFNRNMKIWSAIKKPRPEAFFAELGPSPADGFMRQAFVLSWMMLPRVGGRNFKQTHGILKRMFERNMEAWEEDNRTFTKGAKNRSVKKRVVKNRKKRTR